MNNSPLSHPTEASQAAPDSQDEALFLGLIREMAREGGIETPLTDEEAGRVLAYFSNLEVDYRPLPPEGTPEFLAELQRRAESKAPAISPQTVVAILRSQPPPPR